MTIQKYRLLVLLVISSIMLIGCGPKPDYLAKDYEKPKVIAILPTVNQTVDVAGAEVMRNLTYANLYNYQYTGLKPINQVDSLLRIEGITDGGQLNAMQHDELIETLDVDGIMYIELLKCDYNTVAVKETKHLKTKYTLYNTNGKLYEKEVDTDNSQSLFGGIMEIATNPVGAAKDRALDTGLKGLKGALMDHDLKPEMGANISVLMATLPGKMKKRKRKERI